MFPFDLDGSALREASYASRRLGSAWLQSPAYRRAARAFAGIETCDVERCADTAAALLADADWIAELFEPLIAALAANPWIEPPLRVNRDGLRCGAILFESPAVSITASVLSASALRALPPPRTIVVSGRMSVVRFHRGGGATLRLWEADAADANFHAGQAEPARPAGKIALADGSVHRIDGHTHAQLIEDAASDVVTVTATLRTGAAPLMREYDRASGRLVRSAALDDAAGRTAMLTALLRHMGVNAPEAFDTASRDPLSFVRWNAMREWLAIDARAALPRLAELVDDPNAEVRGAAALMLPKVEAAIACHS